MIFTFAPPESKLARCTFDEDKSAYDRGRQMKYCRCGLPEKHVRHRPEPTRQQPGGRRPRPEPMTVAEANELLASYGGWRKAVKITHPDHGGDAALFRRVQEAREVLRNR